MARTGLYIGIAIVIIIAVVAAVWLASQKPAAPTPTPPATTPSPTPTPTASPTPTPTPTASPTPTPTPKPKLTGNFESDVVAIAKYLVAHGVKEVKYTVWGAGDPNSVMRVYAITEAAYRINKILEKHGIPLKIVVSERFQRGGGDKMAEDFETAFARNANPDIMANSYKHLARFAEEGYILDITSYVEAYKKFMEDFYPSLLEAVKYKGKYYAIPQDTEARPLYWRTDVAACIKEKTGTDILKDLYTRVEKGEVTWKDVYKYAKLAKETGCSGWGVLHRKGSAHPDLIQFIFAFGGRLYDPKTGKLVLDVPAVYKWLYVEWKMAREGLIPKDMMSWDWAKQIHPAVVCGKTLIWIGGTWHWTEWQTKPYCKGHPLTAEEVKKYFYYTLFPAGEPGQKPVTLSQPFVWYIASNAGKDNPKYDELKDVYHMLAFLLVVKASDPDLIAIHSIISAHLPVTRSAAKLLKDKEWLDKLAKLEIPLSDKVKKAIKDIVKATVNPINVEFLANATKLLEYTRLTPIHPYYPKLADLFKLAVDKVLRGEMDPKQAINYLISKIRADPDLNKSVEIVGTIPEGWSFP